MSEGLPPCLSGYEASGGTVKAGAHGVTLMPGKHLERAWEATGRYVLADISEGIVGW